MKTQLSILAGLLASFALAACNSGEITMSQAGQTPTGGQSSLSQRSQSAPGLPGDAMISFDRVSVTDGTPESIIGLGFLRAGATTQSAFGVRFVAPGLYEWRPVLHLESGVDFIKPDNMGQGQEQLLALDPMTLETRPLAMLPSGVKAAAASASPGVVAWVDAAGNAFVSRPGLAPLKLSDGATDVEFVAGTQNLLIRQPSMTLVWRPEAQNLEHYAASEVAIEPVTGRVAMPVDTSVQVIDPRDESELSVGLPEGSQILDLRWGPGGLLAILGSQPGAAGLTLWVAEPSASNARTPEAIPLSLSARLDAPARIVCPAWLGQELYFADANRASFAIFHASRLAGSWNVEPFATVDSSKQGLICPRAGAALTGGAQ